MSKTRQKRTNKKEAKKLVFALHHSRVSIYGDKASTIFDKICKEIEEIKWKRTHFLKLPPKIPFEAPFIQGDGVVIGLPDIIYEAEEYVIGIEHFEFDASGRMSKGSKMRRAELRATEKLEKKAEEINKYPLDLETPVNVNFSHAGYVQSLLDAFRSHSNKIANYKNALQNQYPGKDIFFAFFIEDITGIGNYILMENARIPIPMYPLCVKDFLAAVAVEKEIDFLLFSIQDFYKKELHIQQIDNEIISSFYNDIYDMTKDKYIPYNYKKSLRISRSCNCDNE